MFGELTGELAPATRVLVLELDAPWPERVARSRLCHACLLETLRGGLGAGGELRPLAGRGAVAAAGHHQRACVIRIGEAEMQRSKTAHRQADHMRLVDLETIDYRLN